MRMYLIDGVRVSRKIWERRRIWGEHAGAMFRIWSRQNGWEVY